MSCENESHSHSHGNGDDDSSHVPPIPTSSAQLLNSKIDLPHVTALNLHNPPEDAPKLFKTAQDRYTLKPIIKLDADEQLILHVPFLGSAKLHSVILRTNGDKYCPKAIKLWKNAPEIDFDSVDRKATFTLSHPEVGVVFNDGEDDVPDEIEEEVSFVEHHLPRHIFSGVQHLTILVESIHGDEDECHLHLIELRGEFSELSREPVIAIYELAANPADHKKIDVGGIMRFN